MPLALFLIAIGLILAGVRGKYRELGALLVSDFTGQANFLNWLVAIGIVGCIGYVPALQKWSRMFIALIVLAMFLKQGDGLFGKFVAAIQGAAGTPSDPSPGNPGGGDTDPTAGNPLAALPGVAALQAAGGLPGIIGRAMAPAVAGRGAPAALGGGAPIGGAL